MKHLDNIGFVFALLHCLALGVNGRAGPQQPMTLQQMMAIAKEMEQQYEQEMALQHERLQGQGEFIEKASERNRAKLAEARILTVPTNADENFKFPSVEDALGEKRPFVDFGYNSDDGVFEERDREAKQSVILRAPAPKPLRVVSSRDPARLELALTPESSFSAPPGAVTHVHFLLTNQGPDRQFYTLFHENANGTDTNDNVNFPGDTFLDKVSPKADKIFLRANESVKLNLRLNIPYQTPIGATKFIGLDVQPAGSNKAILLGFYFTVENKAYSTDSAPPISSVVEDNSRAYCALYSTPDTCGNASWQAKLIFQDKESGLKRIDEAPRLEPHSDFSAVFVRDYFIIGSTEPCEFYVRASCCLSRFVLSVTDRAGNSDSCAVGPDVLRTDSGDGDAVVTEAGLSGTTIAIIVAVVVLILVIVAALAALFYIRRKRQAELAEMRDLPQRR